MMSIAYDSFFLPAIKSQKSKKTNITAQYCKWDEMTGNYIFSLIVFENIKNFLWIKTDAIFTF